MLILIDHWRLNAVIQEFSFFIDSLCELLWLNENFQSADLFNHKGSQRGSTEVHKGLAIDYLQRIKTIYNINH